MLNVSARSVTAAAKVIHEGDDELVHAVERGDIAVSAAAKVADLPKAAQRASHIKRRKQIWEALHPAEPQRVAELEREAGRMGGTSSSTHPDGDALGRKKSPQQEKEFAASTATLTGESKQHINRQLAVADALGDDLQKLEGTSLDKGVEIFHTRTYRPGVTPARAVLASPGQPARCSSRSVPPPCPRPA